MTTVRGSAAALPGAFASRRVLAAAVLVAVGVVYALFAGQWTIPHDDKYGLFKSLNDVKVWVAANRTILEPIRAGIAGLVGLFNEILASLGWPGVIGVFAAAGMAFRGVRLALLAGLGFAFIGTMGLWNETMATLSMVLVAVLLAIVIGVPLGIAAGRSKRVASVLAPILDFLQIMPSLAYLTPMTLLFLIGAAPATVATLIFAVPATIRITALGIRSVPTVTVEAARSLGSTDSQVLRKVMLPLARRSIGLAINQTLMLALSMVIITTLIGAPGLGRALQLALQKVDVGASFDPGIAIVILAIILDRLTFAISDWLDPRERASHPRAGGRWASVGAPLAILGAGLMAPVFIDATRFPDAVALSFREPVNLFADWFTTTFHALTIGFKDLISLVVLNPLETFLTNGPWWLVFTVIILVAVRISGRRSALIAMACLSLIGLLGLWQHSMQTLANVLVGTLLTLVIGLVLGILTARSDRFSAFLRPFLDAAQTLPAFVYLIPALALFNPTRFTAIVAAVIYALPPVIRLVEVGIRSVSETVIEAATASGATERQLLWKVRLPMSSGALLLAANQGIVMVLSMVVIGALVGAGALGYDVIAGFTQGRDFGKGLAAGLAIVLLGVLLDRITQGAGGVRRDGTETAG